MTPGLVSCIIPVFNRAGMLTAAVQSVLAQTYRQFEIIIVDDGSTDETGRVADALAAAHPERIRVCHVANGGPGAARETGRLAAQGEFIQYLDSDDRLLPEKFAVQVDALQQHPECGIAYGRTRLVDENGDVLASPYKWSGESRDTLFPGLLVDRWWNTHTPLYRRQVCDAVGPWATMRMAEDWQYDARMGALGTKLVHCNIDVSEHRQHSQDRLTGGQLSRSALKDFSKLIPALYDCARQAGVPPDAAEMHHFIRWTFSLSRQLGHSGLPVEAMHCFDTARQAAEAARAITLDMRVYQTMARFIGWEAAGRLSESTYAVLRRTPRQTRMKQSWMPQ